MSLHFFSSHLLPTEYTLFFQYQELQQLAFPRRRSCITQNFTATQENEAVSEQGCTREKGLIGSRHLGVSGPIEQTNRTDPGDTIQANDSGVEHKVAIG